MGWKGRELDWDVQKKKFGEKQKKKKKKRDKKRTIIGWEGKLYLRKQKQKAKRKGPPGTFVVIFHAFSYF